MNNTKRSGSLITLSDISASTNSMLMSLDEIFERCVISARVFVRSTSESRPSSSDSSSTDRCSTANPAVGVIGVVGADSIDGTCGARKVNAGCWGPKYEENFLDIDLCVVCTCPLRIPIIC